jgi:hypothetical protein
VRLCRTADIAARIQLVVHEASHVSTTVFSRSAFGQDVRYAKLVVGPKAPIIDCRVVDYSPGGACLEIWDETKLPDRFEMVYGSTKKRCRVVWKAGRRLGVSF